MPELILPVPPPSLTKNLPGNYTGYLYTESFLEYDCETDGTDCYNCLTTGHLDTMAAFVSITAVNDSVIKLTTSIDFFSESWTFAISTDLTYQKWEGYTNEHVEFTSFSYSESDSSVIFQNDLYFDFCYDEIHYRKWELTKQ